jgi:hypothetical protein
MVTLSVAEQVAIAFELAGDRTMMETSRLAGEWLPSIGTPAKCRAYPQVRAESARSALPDATPRP